MRLSVMLSTLGLIALAVFCKEAVAEPATVIDDAGCQLLAADSGLPSTLLTTETHATVTSSGNTVLSCHFVIPVGEEPAKAIRNQGFPCGTFLGITNNSRVVSTPGGTASLTCQINGSDKN